MNFSLAFILMIHITSCAMFKSVYSMGLNETVFNENYTLINENNNETKMNSSNSYQNTIEDNSKKEDKYELITNNEGTSTGIFKGIIPMGVFDSYTLILISAFFLGLIMIALLISCAFCICKSINRDKSNQTPGAKITNPIYDIEFQKLANNDDQNAHKQLEQDSPETEKLLPDVEKTELSSLQNNKVNLNDSSNLNTSTGTCSTASINSVVLKPDINTVKQDVNETPIKSEPDNLKTLTNIYYPTSSVKSINKLNETPTKSLKESDKSLIDEMDLSKNDLKGGSVKRLSKFTPVSMAKSTQQLLQEQKLIDSKIPAYKRANSHSNDFNVNDPHRLSTASSRSSIHNEINFDAIKYDIDDWAGNKDNFNSRSNLSSSRNSSQNIDRSESIHDIYIKELIKKHEELKNNKHKHNDESISSSISVNSSIKDKGNKNSVSRRSMNIPVTDILLDPNPTSNLNKKESASVYTISSEKSCY